MRDQVAHLHTELARRYAGKPQPAAERELEAADQAHRAVACAVGAVLGLPEAAARRRRRAAGREGQAPAARACMSASSWSSCTGSRAALPPPTLWQELHAYYRLAEMLDCAVTAVSDDLMPHAVGISCYSTYCHALLLGLADPCAMSVRQIELTDRWLGAVGAQGLSRMRSSARPKARSCSRPRRQRGRRAGSRAAPRDPPRVDALRLSGQARDQRARPAEAPGRRRHARRAAARPRHVGRRLHGAAVASRRALVPAAAARRRRRSHAGSSSSAGGVPAAYFRVGGRTFDRQDPLGRLTFQGAQHLQTLGALTDYDRYKEEAERNWPWERWQGAYEWREASADCARDDGALSLVPRPARRRARRRAHAPRLRRRAWRSTPHGELAMSLTLWPGTPQVVRGAADVASRMPRSRRCRRSCSRRRRRSAATLDRAAAHVQSRAGMLRSMDAGAGAQIPADQARPARRRLRARRVRGDR